MPNVEPTPEERHAMVVATYIIMDDGYELEEAKEHIMWIFQNQKGKAC